MSSLKFYSYLVQWKHDMKRSCKSLKKVKKKKKTNKQNIIHKLKKQINSICNINYAQWINSYEQGKVNLKDNYRQYIQFG